MKHVRKQSCFRSLAASLCLVGCVSLGLKKSAANATSGNSFARDEASADLPQNQKPQPFSVSGKVARADGSGISGVAITFLRNPGSGSLPGSVVTGSDGRWSQTGFETLTGYTANLNKTGFNFQPPAAVFNGPKSDLNFEGTTDPFVKSGKVTTSFREVVSGATISFARVSGPGRVPPAVTTDSSGHWTQSGFEGDTVYRASPNKQGFDFNPASAEFRNVKPVTELSFEGRSNTFTASGRVSTLQGGLGIGGVVMTFSVVSGQGPAPQFVRTDAEGRWSQSGFKNTSTYEVTPNKEGFSFEPGGGAFAFGNPRRTDLNFDALNVLFSLSGKVAIYNGTTPPNGPPIPGVTITFSSTEPNETPPPPVTTDAQGRWHQSGFKKGKDYVVGASKAGFTVALIYSTVHFPNFLDNPGEISFELSRK